MRTDFINENSTIDFSSYEIISFDIFDTLISRAFVEPKDLFLLLEKYALLYTQGKITSFSQIRINAEQALEKQGIHPTIYDIYQHIEKTWFIDTQTCTWLLEKELEIEYEFSIPVKRGIKFFTQAKQQNLKIILTSDMYLPAVLIEKLLAKHGVVGYDFLFVSCEIKKTKRENTLFKYIFDTYGVSSSKFLHIGDNWQNDIINVKKLGGHAIYLPSKQNLLKTHGHFVKFMDDVRGGNLFSSIYLSLTAEKLYSDLLRNNSCHFYNDINTFGYCYLAPVLYAYMTWICKELEKKHIRKIYFFSREGKVLKKIYDEISVYYENMPQSEYVLVSRKFLERACIFDEFDVKQLADKKIQLPMSAGELLYNRFGVKVPADSSMKMETADAQKIDFSSYCLQFKNEILAFSKQQRDNYLAYLKKLSCFDQEEIYVVDIGWQANMQRNFARLLQKKTVGFYFYTHINANKTELLNHSVKGFVLENISNSYNKQLMYHCRQLLEELVCSEDESFLGFDSISNEPIFTFENNNERKALILSCHEGVLQFSKDCAQRIAAKKDFFAANSIYHLSILEELILTLSKQEQKCFAFLNFTDPIYRINTNYEKLFDKKTAFFHEYEKLLYQLPKKTLIEALICKLCLTKTKYKKYTLYRALFFYNSKSFWIRWYLKLFSVK